IIVRSASDLRELHCYFFFSSRRRHTRFSRDWSSDVCSSDLRHLAVLRDRLPERDGPEPEVSALPETPPPAATDRAGLRMAEEGAVANRLRQLSEVTDPALAQLLASVGACEAGHVHLLSEA